MTPNSEQFNCPPNYFDHIKKITDIIKGEQDVEKLLWEICGKTLEIFQCDRAWLLFPCDPSSQSWQVPIERTVAKFPGVSSTNLTVPMTPDVAKIFQTALDNDSPVVYGPEGLPLTENTKGFGVLSQLSMAIYPRSGKPWQFGIHQCSHERVWNDIEIKLFNIIGVMTGEALGNLLLFRELKTEKERLEHRVLKRTAELTETNKELIDSEERYRNLSDAAFEGIIISKDGIILETNEALCRMAGYLPSELVGKLSIDLVPLDERENVKNKILSDYEDPYETHCLRKDGSTFPIEVHARMFSYKDKRVRVAAIRDTTELKRAATLLSECEQLFQSLFENNASVMLLIDPETSSIVYANQAACSYYGYPKETLTTMRITDINALSEKQVYKEMHRAKSEKKTYFNFRHHLSDGSIRDVEVFSGPIFVDDKPLLCSIIHDISDRKQTELERDRLIKKLQNALAEIKTLQGILPLCSYCKKIRDDKGYWEQVDVYIYKHSEADISHSICPECMKTHYPEFLSEED